MEAKTTDGTLGIVWKTVKDNEITIDRPHGGVMSLRIVWDPVSGKDVAYICPTDGDDGNTNAALISVAPQMFQLLRIASKVVSKQAKKDADSDVFTKVWVHICSIISGGELRPSEWKYMNDSAVDAWTFDKGGARGDMRCVKIFTDSHHEMGARACRELAAFLMRSAVWIEEGKGVL